MAAQILTSWMGILGPACLMLVFPLYHPTWSWYFHQCCCLVTKSCLTPATPGTAACQAPLSKGFPREEYWSGLPFSSPGEFPDPEIVPMSPAWQVNSLPLSHLESSVFFFIMLIKTFPPIKIFIYNSLCTPESHRRSGSLSVHLLTCLWWLQFSVEKYLLSNEYKNLKVPLIQINGLEMRNELPSVLQVVTIKPIQR